jgi:hypothetical protein
MMMATPFYFVSNTDDFDLQEDELDDLNDDSLVNSTFSTFLTEIESIPLFCEDGTARGTLSWPSHSSFSIPPAFTRSKLECMKKLGCTTKMLCIIMF